MFGAKMLNSIFSFYRNMPICFDFSKKISLAVLIESFLCLTSDPLHPAT